MLLIINSRLVVYCGVGVEKKICGLAEVKSILFENPGVVAYRFESTSKMVKPILISTLENTVAT